MCIRDRHDPQLRRRPLRNVRRLGFISGELREEDAATALSQHTLQGPFGGCVVVLFGLVHRGREEEESEARLAASSEADSSATAAVWPKKMRVLAMIPQLSDGSGTGGRTAPATLGFVFDAFDLEIGDLDEAQRIELGAGLIRLSAELGDRLDRR